MQFREHVNILRLIPFDHVIMQKEIIREIIIGLKSYEKLLTNSSFHAAATRFNK